MTLTSVCITRLVHVRLTKPTLCSPQLKTEAYSLYNKLEELESKKAELQEQVARQETPDEERDRLLREVRIHRNVV